MTGIHIAAYWYKVDCARDAQCAEKINGEVGDFSTLAGKILYVFRSDMSERVGKDTCVAMILVRKLLY